MLLPNLILQISQHGASLREKPKVFRESKQKQQGCQQRIQISHQRKEEMSDRFIFSIMKPLLLHLHHHFSEDFTAKKAVLAGLAAR